MMNLWLQENLSTILVGLLLVVIVVFIVRTMIRDRKRGVSSCGAGCASCPMGSSCTKMKVKNMTYTR